MTALPELKRYELLTKHTDEGGMIRSEFKDYYLASDVDALLADAMRYRWLRERNAVTAPILVHVPFPAALHISENGSLVFDAVLGEKLDAACDAAMKDKT